MAITVVREKGVTVITMATDSESKVPPLCQILKTLFYSPVCCSLNRKMTRSNAITALGTIQIMVGLFNIGLGPGRTSLHPGDFAHLGVAYWLGGVFILTGIVSLVADRCPCSCLVGFAVLLNIVGSIIAMLGIGLYLHDIQDFSSISLCDDTYGQRSSQDDCRSVEYFFKRLMKAMDITMMVLVSLQLFASITICVLGFRAVCNPRKEEQGGGDDEMYQPILKEVPMTSPGA
ncbi:uncharacterized protein LOC141778456 isoform X1 [Sebastes fasciatus]|uniref:uncharacterized protein LOC141778456 isoform X1 n=1 Tax=Sebastes fasciatus TaxID=394691 RepID=UPI003D9DB8DB